MASNPIPKDPRVGRADAEAVLAARKELGDSMDPALVDSFASRVTAEIQQQMAAERGAQVARSTGAVPAGGRIAVAIVSVVMAIPLTGIMMGTHGGLLGTLICWVGLAVVNIALALRR
ncbi:hypothetical protein [Acidipropionibacterium jensenii]|uniref:Integral membrane protein n=1 Tax=Acidipropionibacterium jensenii TaxID=1749 RepID=A0A3Q9UP49_9ACTN|nr:hypothetical protein [Acidipropionibacterium jensenii]AZZ39757.1 hypothetical protein C0Z10_08325 [Acidipropionibacterium jensenii]AZZ41838.1 hypothetical protein C0Z11_05600 [Acidipropionibacterium jensenii]MDN5976814.1 hypothetical protein [Acidipropionibacterium jensenii]MDN5997140.1 hypothetical protein [Acidipropionibacterium jensenii]MDN6020901.1 hypothetical protein [Acidipropionibacterium jensenii]